MYNFDENVIFTTIAIGQDYCEKTTILIQSVLKFTYSKLVIFSDNPEFFDDKIRYYGNRISVKNIKDHVVNYTDNIEKIFNYNLKYVPFYVLFSEQERILIYLDCDSFVFGWDQSYSRWLSSFDDCLIARCRSNVCDNDNLNKFILPKCESYGVIKEDIKKPLLIENVMVLCKGSNAYRFLEEWKKLHDISVKNKINPFIEALELAIALQRTDFKVIDVHNRMPIIDSFRSLHNGKIMSTWVI